MRKKLNFFRKFLAKLGGKLFWWTQKKMIGLFMAFTYLEDVRMLIDLYDGDMKQALATFYQIGRFVGHDMVYEFVDIGKMIFSQSLEDLTYIMNASWSMMTGETFDSIVYFPPTAENPYPTIVMRPKRCIFCSGLKKDDSLEVTKETMGTNEDPHLTWGAIVSGIVASAVEAIEEYVGNPYKCDVVETKCIMKGDVYPEYTAWLYKEEKEGEG